MPLLSTKDQSLVLTKRIATSGDENGPLASRNVVMLTA